MKPIIFFYFFASFVLAQPAFAQKKDKKDKQTTATTATASKKGVKKDGTPDMRYKKNRDAVQNPTTPPATKTPTTATTTNVSKKTRATKKSTPVTMDNTSVPVSNTPVTRNVPVQGQNKSPDRVVGTDTKGRTIYEGPKGGRYYINGNGNKEYVKQ